MNRDDSEGFLTRWSKRKLQGRTEPDAVPPPRDANAPACEETELTQDEIDAIVARLPRIEDLTPGSSIADFLRKGVPLDLQRAAMRRMWSIDPGIRDFIEVAENQYDWNAVGGCPGYQPLGPGDHSAMIKAALDAFTPPPSETPDDLRQDDAGRKPEPISAENSVGENQSMSVTDGADAAMQTPQLQAEAASSEVAKAQPAALRRRHGGALPA